jgi:uncharacterized protein YdaU (DUF1376 family)
MEDLAYRRMLDLYYRTEAALPEDYKDIARLIRMKDHLEAIDTVLTEFFTLADDGWHSKRADDELTAMKTKQEQQATKDDHEAERLRRHRARRAEMFAALRGVGVIPAWDVAMKELQRLFDTHCNAPETRTQPLPATDSQRLSLPTPTPTPEVIQKKRASAPRVARPDDVAEQVWTDWVAHRKAKRATVTETVLAGAREEAGKAGLTLEAFLQVWCRRGSIGMEASWLKPAAFGPANPNQSIEPEWRRIQRERNEAVLGPAAQKRATQTVIDMELTNGPLTRIA